jgi:hypothetical protein
MEASVDSDSKRPMRSARVITSAGEAAGAAPLAARAASLSLERFQATTSRPALISRRAMGVPISPRPIEPTLKGRAPIGRRRYALPRRDEQVRR